MSLQAWYPLNGNTNNYGVGQLKPTVTTTPAYVAGKVGNKAVSVGGLQWSAAQTASVLNNSAISIAFWYKALNSNSGEPIFGNTSMAPPNNRKFTLYSYPTMNDFHWSWQNDNSSGATNGGTINGCFPTNQWVHCCITYENGLSQVYINGVLKQSATGTIANATYEYTTPVLHNSNNRHIQDLRFYNHCLSPREVKELAQGLVLHYTLNNNNNTNMLTKSYTMNGATTSIDSTYGFPVCNADNAAGTGYKDFASWGGFPVVPNEVYTVSFYAKSVSSSTLIMYFYNNTSGVVQVSNIKSSEGHNKAGTDGNCPLVLTPQWKKYWVTWTFNSSGTNANKTLLFRLAAGGKCDVALPKLEKGSVATPYGLKPAEMIQPLVEYDCSGYGHHGTRSTALSYISNKDGRYSNSTHFNSGNKITTTAFSTAGWPDCTMAAWVRPTNTANGTDINCIIIGGIYLAIRTANNCVTTYCYGKNPEGYHTGKTALPLNQWSHIAAVWDGAAEVHKIYVNGVEDLSITCTGVANGGSQDKKDIGLENSSRPYVGDLSDVRIYATALSAADIKTLYNSSMAMLSSGQFQAYEFNEGPDVTNIKMHKTGSFASSDISEVGYTGGMKVKVLPDGSAWARIHWLDVSTDSTYFANATEVAFCNKANRFSRMGLVDHFKVNNKYEFMLTYPRLSATAYNRWSQTSSPNSGTVTDFKAISTSWSGHNAGIRKNGSACVYNCDSGSTWYAPIGQLSRWTETQAIPAADGSAQTETELWVRINNIDKLKKISMLDNEYLQALNIYEI